MLETLCPLFPIDCRLPKLNVAGSIPVSRSITVNNLASSHPSSLVQIWPIFPFRLGIRLSHDQIAYVYVCLTVTLTKGEADFPYRSLVRSSPWRRSFICTSFTFFGSSLST